MTGMTGPVFRIRIVTPLSSTEREVQYIRLKDDTGYLGLMKGHTGLLTTLVPSLVYFTDRDGEEVFMAVNGGVLSIREGAVTLTAREVYEGKDAEQLSETIRGVIREKDTAEKTFESMLEGLERSFIEKTLELERSRG